MNLKCLVLSVFACMTIQIVAMESNNQGQSEGEISEQIKKLSLQKTRIDGVLAWYKGLDEKKTEEIRNQFSILSQAQVDILIAEMAAKLYKSMIEQKGRISNDHQLMACSPELNDLSFRLAQQFCDIMFLTTDIVLAQNEEKVKNTHAETIFISCREFNKLFYDAVDKEEFSLQITNDLIGTRGDFQKFFNELRITEKQTEEDSYKYRLNFLLNTLLKTIKIPLKDDALINPESFSHKLANQIEMLKHGKKIIFRGTTCQ